MTRVLLAVALAALLTAVWFLVSGSAPRVPQQQPDPADEPAATAEPTPGASEAAPAPASDAEADTAPELRQPVELAPPQLTVKVAHRDGSPAATGTEVAAITADDVTALEWLQLTDSEHALDPEHLLALDSVVRQATDAGGISHLPRPAAPTWLVARERAGDLARYAFDRVDAGTADAELRLEPRSPLHVRVLDRFERPVANVPIQLTGFGHAGVRWGHALSDAAGLARLWGWTAMRDHNMRKSGAGPLSVAAVIPSEDPVTASVPLTHDPRETVELRLPPTCEIVVRVVGLEPGLHGQVALKPWPKMPGDFSVPLYSSPLAPLVDGTARFPWVTLDYRFQLWVWLDGYDGELHLRPTSAKRDGERQEIVFDASDAMLLTGRLVDAEGAPLQGTHSANYTLSGPNWSNGRSASLDADGRFRILISKVSVFTSLESLAFTHLVDRRKRGELTIPLADGFEPGRHDFGTLRLAPIDTGR